MSALAQPGVPGGSLPGGGGSARGGTRLRLRHNPLRLAVSPGLWAGAGYLLAYQVAGWLLFGAVLAVLMTSALLAVTLAGLPMLVAAAGAIRGCANVERGRLRTVFAEPVRGGYREVTGSGIMARLRVRWRDPAIWRDIAYLAGLWAPLTIVGAAVIIIWAWFISMITLPFWYWAPWTEYHGRRYHGYQLGFYYPHGPYGRGAAGVFIGSLPAALAAAGVGLAGFLVMNYVLVITARAHATIARSLLRPPPDPLAGAKAVLARPGPLPSLVATPAEQADGRAPP